jgi:hypothetical protein
VYSSPAARSRSALPPRRSFLLLVASSG